MKNFYSYLKKLITKASTIVLFLVDIIYVIAGLISKEIVLSPLIYLGLIFAGIFFGGYQIYKESLKESIDLLVLFHNIKSPSQGVYKIKLIKIDSNFIEKKVKSKIKALNKAYNDFKNKREMKTPSSIIQIIDSLDNENYLKELDKYKIDYQNYLKYLEAFDKRLIDFSLNVKNTSQVTLTNICIEFIIPKPLKIPDPDQRSIKHYGHNQIPPPLEPKLRNVLDIHTPSFSGLFVPPTNHDIATLRRREDISGPYFDKEATIYYKINKLIPDYLENNFDPFCLWFTDINLHQDLSIPIKVYCSESPVFLAKEILLKIYVE